MKKGENKSKDVCLRTGLVWWWLIMQQGTAQCNGAASA